MTVTLFFYIGTNDPFDKIKSIVSAMLMEAASHIIHFFKNRQYQVFP